VKILEKWVEEVDSVRKDVKILIDELEVLNKYSPELKEHAETVQDLFTYLVDARDALELVINIVEEDSGSKTQ